MIRFVTLAAVAAFAVAAPASAAEVRVALAGKSAKLTANVRGLSNLDAARLTAKDARIGAEGPSTVKANVTNEATITAAGVAEIALAGGPTCTSKLTGSASVSGCR